MTGTTARGLKTGDLVTLGSGRRAVVESVSEDGSWFTATAGASYLAADAELVPLAPAEPAA